jgi:PAS domain S-box-containing protein
MANERATSFWIESGNECLADVYWKQAYICYNRWGAKAKVYSMENEYRVRIAKNFPEIKGSGVTTKQEQEIKNDFLDKQIKLLRYYALQIQQTKLLNEAKTHASELAHAAQRLRIEIAERKRTEQALRESKERFEKLFVEAPLGIALINSFTGEIHEVNPMFAKIAGRAMEEIPHIDWMSITHPDDIQENLDNMALMNAGKIPGFQMEKRYLQHDGTSVWINMTIAPVYVEDHTQPRHLCMIEDITERRQTQEQIKIQNEELQRINAEINKFFSIIAHDLLVPFNGFLGLTQVMAEELPSLTMAEVQGIAVRMSKSATNLYLLLENLLEWSRIQQGAVPFNPEVIQLGLVFGEIIDVIHESAKSKEIEIATDIPAESGVFADPYMLQTVIRNLVSNAIKFTPKGGKVSLLAKVATDHSVEISIQDTGIGMSQTLIENLFRIDVQTNRKGTEGEPSTGLGLLLCKEFVEKHSGKVWVESEEGIGSTFYFTLPYNIESEEKQVV